MREDSNNFLKQHLLIKHSLIFKSIWSKMINDYSIRFSLVFHVKLKIEK